MDSSWNILHGGARRPIESQTQKNILAIPTRFYKALALFNYAALFCPLGAPQARPIRHFAALALPQIAAEQGKKEGRREGGKGQKGQAAAIAIHSHREIQRNGVVTQSVDNL